MLKFHPLKVAERRVEPEEAIYLTFAVPPALRDEYRFVPGQHIGIRAMLDGQEERRTYSIVSGPGEEGLRIAARVHDRGRMSGYLARGVRAGDSLEVLTPNGSFHTRLAGNQRRTVVAFAGSNRAKAYDLAVPNTSSGFLSPSRSCISTVSVVMVGSTSEWFHRRDSPRGFT